MLYQLLVIFFSITLVSNDTIIFHLRNREMVGKANTKKLRICLVPRQYPEVIKTLQNVENPLDFIKSIPEKCFPSETASFEYNLLMDIIPAALKTKTQQFKNQVLDDHLPRCWSRLDYYVHIALIDSGAKHNNGLRVGYAYRGRTDYEYARALIKRGANPNSRCKYFSQEHKYEEEHISLCDISDLNFIKSMFDGGANVHARSSKSNKTFVH